MSNNRQANEEDALLAKAEEGTKGGPGHRKVQSVDFNNPNDRRAPMRAMKTRHRKHMSSISELMSHLEPIGEEFQATGRLMGESLRRRLNTMDRGETGFFDMSITRSLSVLPDDLEELMEDVGVEVTIENAQAGPPLFQYLALLSAVASISSNSTALHMLDGVSAPMKLYWRMTASYIVLAPFAVHSIRKDGFPKLNVSGWIAFVAAVLAYTTQGCFFVSALDFTTIGNAVIYANSQALLLIIGKAFMGERIHPFEAFGVFVAFSGAILCSTDSEGSSQESDASTLAIFGDLLALAAAVGGVVYLTFAKAVRAEMSVTVFIFSVMFFGSFMILAYISVTDGLNLEFSMDPYIGVFGWLNMSQGRLPILLYLAVVVNILGTMGFVRAMQYFDNIVIAVATLMEPLMASLIAYAFHAGLLPGPMGWLGNLLVVAGTLGVVYPSIGKAEGGGAH
jgi:drug/metabolite transporter (DMT)-like permease